MFKFIAAFAVAAVLGVGLTATSASAVGTCAIGGNAAFTPPNVFPVGDVSTTSLCSGIFDAGLTVVTGAVETLGTPAAIGSQQEANEFSINALAFANHRDWTLAEEVSGGQETSNDNGFGLTIKKTNGDPLSAFYPQSGQWSVTSFGTDAVRAAIAILNNNNDWAVYLLTDLSLTSGAWTFLNNYEASVVKGRELQSFQLYISTEVPVPAALPMLLTGLAGFAIFKRRKRAA